MFKHVLTGLWNRRRRNGLLVLQILLSFLVLFAAFTFGVDSLTRFAAPLGFEPADRQLVSLRFAEGIDPGVADSVNRLPSPQAQLIQSVRDVQGVLGASYIGWVTPFAGGAMSAVDGSLGFDMAFEVFHADDRYAEVAGVEVAEGRWYTGDDTLGGNQPIVVNRAFQERYFPNTKLVDTLLPIGDKPWLVVGVVEHFKYNGDFSADKPLGIFYNPNDKQDLVVELAAGAGPTVLRELSETVTSITKSRESTIESLSYLRQRSNRAYWIPLIVLSITGLFLLTNVALGLFGVLINAIQRRRAEIGLRKALGATSAQIGQLFTLEVVLLTAIALLLGAVLALQVPLLDILPVDICDFLLGGSLAAGVILVIILLCALVPSLRAANTEAAVALSEE